MATGTTPTQEQRLADSIAVWREFAYQHAADIRCAEPGVIVAVNTNQTVQVQLAIRERLVLSGVQEDLAIPVLPEVPLVIPRAGGYSITLPVSVGDEVLVVFADKSIEDWFQNGTDPASGNSVNQLGVRRHDLNDAFAIPGAYSQPRVVPNYDPDSLEIRTDDGTVVINLSVNSIQITAPAVTITSPAISIGSSTGTPQAAVLAAFWTYYTTLVYPFLVTKGFTGGPAPGNSVSTALTAD